MNITILCVGKLKEDYLKELQTYYLDKINSMKNIKIRIQEVPDYADSSVSTVKEAEGLLMHLDKKKNVICLDLQGRRGVELGDILSEERENVFVIGGSNGLHESLLKLSNYRICLSSLTFPHQLARMVVLDLIYQKK